MIDTKPVRYRPMTLDEVLAELKAFCRNELGFDDAAIADCVCVDATLAEFGTALHHDEDLSELEPYFGVKCSIEWWAQWKPEHTVGELCADLAVRVGVPILEPATVLGTPCETAGAFLTLKRMLADAGADVSALAPSSDVLPYLRERSDVFNRFRLATDGRLPTFGAVAPLSCLIGSLMVIAGAVLIGSIGAQWLGLFMFGALVAGFGFLRPKNYPCLAQHQLTTFRDLIHRALGRPARVRAA